MWIWRKRLTGDGSEGLLALADNLVLQGKSFISVEIFDKKPDISQIY